MNMKLNLYAALLSATLLPGLALADTASDSTTTSTTSTTSSTTTSNPWSFSASIGQSQSGADAAGLQSQLQRAGGTVVVSALDESATAFSLAVNYQLHPNWSVEAGVMGLGAFEGRIQATNTNLDTLRAEAKKAHPVGGTGVNLAVQGAYPIGRWQLSGQLGGFKSLNTDIDLQANGQKVTVKGQSTSLLLGAGVAYAITPQWSLGLKLTALDLNDSVLVTGLAVQYRPD